MFYHKIKHGTPQPRRLGIREFLGPITTTFYQEELFTGIDKIIRLQRVADISIGRSVDGDRLG